ncbi:MAG: phosphoglycerate dehydrogenase [Kofleriaceae bacterium]|nr:phosphoglycerate dehydrogenase [Kofleriaceae bacterium]
MITPAPLPPTSFPKTEIKILLLENVHRSADELFGAEGFQIERASGALREDELVERVRDVHVLGIRSKTRVTPRVLDAGRRLLAVGAFCIGTNQIDLAHANARGVPVFNAPFSNTRSVAEMVLAETIILSRQLFDRSREVHDGTWRKLATNCHEIRGKTLGIVGYGHIGRQVGVLAEMVGMHVVFFDIAARLPMGNNRAVPGLAELLASSDFVTLHVPETPQTRLMIGATELAQMKPGSFLLNASRGTVVDLDALADAVRRGHLAGAAVDVYPEEPETNSDGFASVLRGLPNVVLTPHIGGSTEEAQEAIGREVSGALTKFINNGATTGAVNFPQLEMPQARDTHRILNIHRNVPGVVRDITAIISERGANIHAQMLATDPVIGYLIMDLDQAVSHEVKKAVAALDTSLRTRILY